jgi:hypothetical protein
VEDEAMTTSRALTALLAVALLLAAGVSSVPHTALAGGQGTTTSGATQVILFVPPVRTGPSASGSCFTSSIAVERPPAWRCSAGNFLLDPCFNLSTQPLRSVRTLICVTSPVGGKVLILHLTKPLDPKLQNRFVQPFQPWTFSLSDGTVCQRFTGTLAAAVQGGKAVTFPYGCIGSHSTVAMILSRGHTWMAEKATLDCSKPSSSPNLPSCRVTSSVRLAINTVWI